jgi:hypothetical protein
LEIAQDQLILALIQLPDGLRGARSYIDFVAARLKYGLESKPTGWILVHQQDPG